MVEWNILATAEPGRDRDLLRELNQWGEFRRPGFRGVLIGHVADVNQFLEAVRRAGEQQVRWVEDLATGIPRRTALPGHAGDFRGAVERSCGALCRAHG